VIPYRAGTSSISFYHNRGTASGLSFSDEESWSKDASFPETGTGNSIDRSTQLLTFSVVTPKADLAFMLLTAILHKANHRKKRSPSRSGRNVLTRPLQLSEHDRSSAEYTIDGGAVWREQMRRRRRRKAATEFSEKIAEYNRRIEKYTSNRTVFFPRTIAGRPVFCFYRWSNERRCEARMVWRGIRIPSQDDVRHAKVWPPVGLKNRPTHHRINRTRTKYEVGCDALLRINAGTSRKSSTKSSTRCRFRRSSPP